MLSVSIRRNALSKFLVYSVMHQLQYDSRYLAQINYNRTRMIVTVLSYQSYQTNVSKLKKDTGIDLSHNFTSCAIYLGWVGVKCEE